MRVVRGPDDFARVAADAEQYSIDRTDSSRTSTIRGPGATAGHGLMVMGEWAVRSADAVNTRVRLRRILSLSGQPDRWTLEHAQSILEYQRLDHALCNSSLSLMCAIHWQNLCIY